MVVGNRPGLGERDPRAKKGPDRREAGPSPPTDAYVLLRPCVPSDPGFHHLLVRGLLFVLARSPSADRFAPPSPGHPRRA